MNPLLQDILSLGASKVTSVVYFHQSTDFQNTNRLKKNTGAALTVLHLSPSQSQECPDCLAVHESWKWEDGLEPRATPCYQCTAKTGTCWREFRGHQGDLRAAAPQPWGKLRELGLWSLENTPWRIYSSLPVAKEACKRAGEGIFRRACSDRGEWLLTEKGHVWTGY